MPRGLFDFFVNALRQKLDRSTAYYMYDKLHYGNIPVASESDDAASVFHQRGGSKGT